MKKTTVIRTCMIAASAIVLNSLGAQAQETAGIVKLSNYRPVQRTAFDASQTGCADGCGDSACATCPTEGCGTNGAVCGDCNGAGCASGPCQPRGRWLRRLTPGMAGCQTGACQDGCQSGACQGGCPTGACQNGMCANGACQNGNCPPGGYSRADQRRMDRLCRQQSRSHLNATQGNFWARSSRAYQSRNARVSQHLFGWMIPAGNNGQGAAPFGHYNMVYSQNPDYADPRDGGVYAAQGYGTHVTVPLAPHVRHAYNYGWGMPSSRISHVSSVAPYTLPRPLHW